MHTLRGGSVPDNDGCVGFDELHRLSDGPVLFGYWTKCSMQCLRGWPICVEYWEHSMRGVLSGTILGFDGYGDLHTMCSGSVPDDFGRVGIHKLHRLCDGPVLGRYGPGKRV